MQRDPRVALNIADPTNPSRYYDIRGRAVDITTGGAVEHIEALAQKYLGAPYPWFGGRDQQRLIDPSRPTRCTHRRAEPATQAAGPGR